MHSMACTQLLKIVPGTTEYLQSWWGHVWLLFDQQSVLMINNQYTYLKMIPQVRKSMWANVCEYCVPKQLNFHRYV